MTSALLSSNILIYSLQIAALVAAAAVASLLLKFEAARVRLLYWQTVWLACLLLPWMRSWKQATPRGDVRVTMAAGTAISTQTAPEFPFTWSAAVLAVLAAGICIRVVLLGVGFWRLRGYRLHSRPLEPACAWGAEADLRVSEEVPGPVTFGWRRPVVLLPADFLSLDESVREAVLCHEVLHVRRNDWLFTVGEEVVRAVFWFHPAVWWLAGEVQLAREQAVDQEVVAITRGRDCYVDALLAVAGAAARLDVAPAPLFLRRRHLKRRVFSILKEVKMSKIRTFSTVGGSMAVLVLAGWFLTGSLPLQAAPQAAGDASASSLVSLHRIVIMGVPEQQKADIVSRLSDAGIQLGQQQLNPEGLRLTAQTIASTYVALNLTVQVKRLEADQVDLFIGTPEAAQVAYGTAFAGDAHPIRVETAVADQNVISKATPVYPSLAKAARAQGTVRIEIVIDKEGHVQNPRLISGHPLLVKSALDAIQQWVYRPTLLNSEPVEVVTTVDINFTLAP